MGVKGFGTVQSRLEVRKMDHDQREGWRGRDSHPNRRGRSNPQRSISTEGSRDSSPVRLRQGTGLARSRTRNERSDASGSRIPIAKAQGAREAKGERKSINTGHASEDPRPREERRTRSLDVSKMGRISTISGTGKP